MSRFIKGDFAVGVLTAFLFPVWIIGALRRVNFVDNANVHDCLFLIVSFFMCPFIHVFPLLITFCPAFYLSHRSSLVAIGRIVTGATADWNHSLSIKMGMGSVLRAVVIGPIGTPGFLFGALMPTPDAPLLHLVSGLISQALLVRTRAFLYKDWGTLPWLAMELYQAAAPTLVTLYLRRKTQWQTLGSLPGPPKEPKGCYRGAFVCRKGSKPFSLKTQVEAQAEAAGRSSNPGPSVAPRSLDSPPHTWSTYKFLGSLRPQDLSPAALEALTAAVRKQAEAKLSRPVRLALSVYEGCVMLRLSAWSPSELDLGAAAGGGGWEDVSADAELDASVLLSMLPPDLRARVSAAVSDMGAPGRLELALDGPALEMPSALLSRKGGAGRVRLVLAVLGGQLPAQVEPSDSVTERSALMAEPAGMDPSSRLEFLSSRYRPVAWEAHRTGSCPTADLKWSLGNDGALRVTFDLQVGPPDVQGTGGSRGIGASLLIAGLEPLRGGGGGGPEPPAPSHTAATAEVLLLSPSVLSDLRRSSDAVQADLESDIATLLSLRASPAFREARDEGLVEMVRGAAGRMRIFATGDGLQALAALADLLSQPPCGGSSPRTMIPRAISLVSGIMGLTAVGKDTSQQALGFLWNCLHHSGPGRRLPDPLELRCAARLQRLSMERMAFLSALRLVVCLMLVPKTVPWIGFTLATFGAFAGLFSAVRSIAESKESRLGLPVGPVFSSLAILLTLLINAIVPIVFAAMACLSDTRGSPSGSFKSSWRFVDSISGMERFDIFGSDSILHNKYLRVVLFEALFISLGSIGFGAPFAAANALLAASASEWSLDRVNESRSDSLQGLLLHFVRSVAGAGTMRPCVFLRTGLTLALWGFFERRARAQLALEVCERRRRESAAKAQGAEREAMGREAAAAAAALNGSGLGGRSGDL